jgi:hypothetical protein
MEVLVAMRGVDASKLSCQECYAIQLGGADGYELGRFIGMSEAGASFTLVPHLVRKDRAAESITVTPDAILRTVFEFKEEKQ